MERAAWTDERLDDLAEGMRSGFTRLDNDLRGVRSEIASLRDEMGDELRSFREEIRVEFGAVREEMRGEFGAIRGEITEVGIGLRGEISGLRGEIDGLRRVMLSVGGGIIVGLLGVIAAILARGV